jgi:hypothetical protein
MKRFISLSLAIFTCVCLLVASERRAMAYVDPGSGFLAIQSIASAMAATGYFARRRILALFKKKKADPAIEPVVVKKDTREAA